MMSTLICSEKPKTWVLGCPEKPKSWPFSAQKSLYFWLHYSSLGISLPRLGLWKISESGLMGSGGLVRVTIPYWGMGYNGKDLTKAPKFSQANQNLALLVIIYQASFHKIPHSCSCRIASKMEEEGNKYQLKLRRAMIT